MKERKKTEKLKFGKEKNSVLILVRTHAPLLTTWNQSERTGGQAISNCTSPNLRNMEVKSLCIDLMPDRQIHGQTDRQIHRQTGRHKVGNQEANRTYRVLIRIIREKKVLQERGKAKFENENENYNKFSS